MMNIIDKISASHRNAVLIAALVLLLLTSIAAFLFEPVFSGTPVTYIWIGLSQSGTFVGISTILILMFMFAFFYDRDTSRHLGKTAYAFIIIAALTGSTALVNNFLVKENVRVPRPSHLYLEQKGFMPEGLDNFYSMSLNERRKYLSGMAAEMKDSLNIDIYPPVFNIWLKETALSFPSGHAVNSFLLGTIFAYIIFRRLKGRKKLLYAIPLLWASAVSLSRVALGVHYPSDIAGGGALGILYAAMFLYSGIMDRFLFPSDEPAEDLEEISEEI